jgi:hypothetical protein
MASYESVTSTLEAELTGVTDVFGSLAPEQWQRPTLLVPVDPELPRWTVFELAGHFDIAIGLTRMLIAGQEEAQPARDRTSFFINPRSETGPVVYSYAYTMVEGKTPADMPGVLAETCWPGGPPAAGRPSYPTTWTGSWPRRAGPNPATTGSR